MPGKTTFGVIRGYSVPSTFLNIRMAAVLLLGEITLGIVGFMFLEDYTLNQAFYMTIITIATVGFTEVKPLSEIGHFFTSFLIIINIGIFTYTLAVFSFYIVQGEIFKSFYSKLIATQIGKLENHVIVCGYGRYGREIVQYLQKHGQSFVVIEKDPQRIQEMQKSTQILYVQEDATHDEALLAAGIRRAGTLVTALHDDADNVYTILTAKQLNPHVRVISRATDPRAKKKLEIAGAEHVVLPELIGGFYMANLVSRPKAVEFFSFITNEFATDIGFEEVQSNLLPPAFLGKSLGELDIQGKTGANIIGLVRSNGANIINPEPHEQIQPGSSLIIIGSPLQLQRMREMLVLS
ncbi:MAG TPA: potassium channel protein [Saprospiraceae bacterium]|nr:potassium channel protein [Saprospiraceae bacterium]